MLDSLETIALSPYPVKGYAASLYYFITGEDVVLEKLLEEEKAEEKEESLLSGPMNGNAEFSVYPNPASEQLTVKTETELTSLSVYDVNGKNWLLRKFGNLQSLDISILPKGLYLLKATSESGKFYNIKFIKQ